MSKKRRHRGKSNGPSQQVREKVPALTPELRDRLLEWVHEAAAAHELVVWDAEITQQGPWIVRAFVEPQGQYEQEDGVTVAQCTQVSRYVEALMDADEQVPERYTIEISSPGIERALKTPEHYQKMAGQTARLKLRQNIGGEYTLDGVVASAHEHHIVLEVTDGDDVRSHEIDYTNIKRAHILYDFGQ